MDDNRYQNREIDAKHDEVLKKIDSLQDVLKSRMETFEHDARNSLSRIETQVSYTNGKVRKITIALVLIAGVVIGLGFTEAKVVLPLFL